MRALLCLALLLVAAPALFALPQPPPTPGGPAVSIVLPAEGAAIAGEEVLVRYNHSAPERLHCTAAIDSDGWSDDDPRWSDANLSKYAQVDPGGSGSAAFRNVAPGAHDVDVYCSDAGSTYTVWATRAFTVTAGQPVGVAILSPAESAGAAFVLQYRHNATGQGMCGVAIDGNDLRRNATVFGGSIRSEQISDVLAGSREITVRCTGDGWAASASAAVEVSAEARLEVSPRIVSPGEAVSILADFPPQTSVTVSVIDPVGFDRSWDVLVEESLDTEYLVPEDAASGTYGVDVFTATGDMLHGTFEVRAEPIIVLSSTQVAAGTPFELYGEFFPPERTITILIDGAMALRNSTVTDSAGAFRFVSHGLPAGTYTITAQAASGPSPSVTLAVTGEGDVAPAGPYEEAYDLPPEPAWTVSVGEQDAPVGEPLESDIGPFFPEPAAPAVESPAPAVEKGSYLWRVLAGVLILALVAAGVGGYLVHQRSLDVSSLHGLKESAAHLFSGRAPPAMSPVPLAPAEVVTVKAFIGQERAKGFDDLTIRSALLAKGWDKRTVDASFDELYRKQ